VVELSFYWSQLDNVLMYVSIYGIFVTDCVTRVQGGAVVVDPFDDALVVAVDLYCSICL